MPGWTRIYGEGDIIPVVDGGTGAANVADARTNLGLGSVLSDISSIITKLSSVVFNTKYITGGSSALYTFNTTCSFAILISGATNGNKCIVLGHCTTGGTVTLDKITGDGGGTISLSPGTSTLLVGNEGSVNANILLIRIAGTLPTVT